MRRKRIFLALFDTGVLHRVKSKNSVTDSRARKWQLKKNIEVEKKNGTKNCFKNRESSL